MSPPYIQRCPVGCAGSLNGEDIVLPEDSLLRGSVCGQLGGRTIGSTWAYFSIALHGGHISFFTPDSLKKLTGNADFCKPLLKTRSVRFRDRQHYAEPLYSILKIAAELSNPLASLLDKGEDMALYLRRC